MRTAKFIISSCFIFSFALMFALQSEAKLTIEPYIGLAKQEVHLDGGLADIANGFALGVKLNIPFASNFYFGADYMQGGPYKWGSLLQNVEMTNTMIGAVLGADYQIIRYWIGYYFDDTFAVSTGNMNYIGTAIKGGFGLTASNKFRANLELIYHNISKIEFSGMSTEVKDYGFITTMVTLSIPINID